MKRLQPAAIILALLLALPACGAGAAENPAPSARNSSTAQLSQAAAPADAVEEAVMDKITLSFNGHTYTATLADNPSAGAFAELLREGPLTISAHDYGNFEKVGALGTTLPRTDEQITTSPGDIILYQGNQITVYYAQNTWRFTRLGRIDDPSGLREALGSGDVEIIFQLAPSEPPSHFPKDMIY